MGLIKNASRRAQEWRRVSLHENRGQEQAELVKCSYERFYQQQWEVLIKIDSVGDCRQEKVRLIRSISVGDPYGRNKWGLTRMSAGVLRNMLGLVKKVKIKGLQIQEGLVKTIYGRGKD